jgi:hypothetical protein
MKMLNNNGPFWVTAPEILGRAIGFMDLTSLHGEWIREMAFGEGDFTLQAHRGSFKSSCLAVAISLILITYPDRNIIFIRKTDNDVSEMMGILAALTLATMDGCIGIARAPRRRSRVSRAPRAAGSGLAKPFSLRLRLAKKEARPHAHP